MYGENSQAGWLAVLLWTVAVGVVMFYVGYFAGGTDMLAECWGIER